MALPDTTEDNNGKKKWFLLAWAVMECLMFSGLLFGWGSLSFVLKLEGIYADLCEEPSGTVEVTPNENTASWINLTTSSSNENNGVYQEPCKPQDDKMALCFTIASTMMGVWCAVIGLVNCRFGTRATRLISLVVFESGAIMMAMVSKETPWLMFPGFALISMGGMPILVTNMQVANLFAVGSASVVCLLNGLFDSSSIVMLLLKIAHGYGFVRRNFFFAIAGALSLVLISTLCFLPKTFIQKIIIDDLPTVDSKKEIKSDSEDPKSLMGSLNLRGCLFSKVYLTNLVYLSTLNLRFQYFTGTLNQYLIRLLRDEQLVSYFTDVCFYTMIFGVIGSFVTGALYDWQIQRCKDGKSSLYRLIMPSVLPLAVTTFFTLLLSILVLIPQTDLLYLAFIMMTNCRSFLFSATSTVLSNTFPGQYLVFLYGSMNFLSQTFSFVQYPIYKWSVWYNGGHVHADIFLLCLTFLSFLQPLYWWIACRQEEKKLMKYTCEK